MIFGHPYMLLFLIAVPLAFRHGKLGISSAKAVCITAAVFALAQPLLTWKTLPERTHVIVADVSDVISDDALEKTNQQIQKASQKLSTGEKLKVIAYADRAVETPQQPLQRRGFDTSGASLADALQLAGTSIPGAGGVMVITDGNSATGDAAAEAMRLADRGITIDSVAVQPLLKDPFILASAELPAFGGIGQTVPLTLRFRAPHPIDLKIQAFSGNQKIFARIKQAVPAGESALAIPVTLPNAGLFSMQVIAETEGCHQQLTAAAQVTSPRRISVVETTPGGQTAAALQALLGSSAIVSTGDVAQAVGSDLIVIGDTPASDISKASQDAIAHAVTDGTGLLFLGGPHALGPGGWGSSSLAGLMPVGFPQVEQQEDPSASIVFVIDTSGSMKGAPISLAKDVARLAIQQLQPQDKAGIVEFFGSKRWAAPLQSAANHLDLNRALNRLDAYGGTVIMPAILEAEFGLKNVSTRTRHVILLTDGGVENAPFESVIRRMVSEGQTVSTVLVAPDPSPLLENMAQWGHGRFYHVTDPYNLPQILLHLPQTDLPPALVLSPSMLVPAAVNPMTKDIDFSACPAIDGYVRVTAKPTADLLLKSDQGDPMLIKWQYGRGRVAVFPTSLGSNWTGAFFRSPDSAKLVSSLCRSLYSLPREQSLNLQPILRPAGIEISITATTGEPDQLTAPVSVELLKDGKPIARQMIDPIAVGNWDVLFADQPPGVYQARAVTDQPKPLAGTAAIAVPPSQTKRAYTPNTALFDQFSQLAKNAKPISIVRQDSYVDLTKPLILMSMLLLLVHVLLRRWPATAMRGVSKPRSSLVTASVVIALLWGRSIFADTGITEQAELQQATAYFDKGDIQSATQSLRALAGTGDSQAVHATWIAMLYNQPQLAAELMSASGNSSDFDIRMLRGICLLNIGKPQQAQEVFRGALSLANTPRDRRFALERIIACSRKSATLNQLADQWLSDRPLPADQQLLLVGVLRELHRTDDLIAFWHRGGDTKLLGDELLAAAVAAGRIDDAQKMIERSLDADPSNLTSLSVLVDLLVQGNHFDQADAVLHSHEQSADSLLSLLAIAGIAHANGRDENAITAATSATRFGDAAGVQGILLAASIERERGHAQSESSLLSKAVSLCGHDPSLLTMTADAFDQAGDLSKAIELQSRAVDAAGADENAKVHLAWFLERDNQLPAAQAIWQNIWKSASSPGRQREAEQQLISLANRDGSVAQLASQLENSLSDSRGDAKTLQLLVQIDEFQKNTAAAVELLNAHAKLLPGQAAMLNQLFEVDVRGGKLDDAEKVLDQLITADPDHADQTLQKRIVLAIQRKKPAEAIQLVTKLQQKSTNDPGGTAELLAGIYSQLGMPHQAADAYQQAVNANPDQAEDWLLWSQAMVHAGQRGLAEQKMVALADGSASDDTFAVAIDGLLNLQASPEILRSARRLVIARLCQTDGRKLYLFELLRDLSDELKEPDFTARSLELSLIFAGEQRTELLRDLMAATRSVDATPQSDDRLIDQERMLLALADYVPSQDFLEMGQRLLTDGRLADADAAFRRAIEQASGPDADDIRQTVAQYYESAGKLDTALQMLSPVFNHRTPGIALLVQAGGLKEQLNDAHGAFEDYLQGVNLVIAQNHVGVALATAQMPVGSGPVSISYDQQYAQGLVQGAIACARRPEDAAALIQTVETAARAADRSGEKTADVCFDLARLLRQVSFSLHQPEIADRWDRELMARHPADPLLIASALSDRITWGLFDRAIKLAPQGYDLPPQLMALKPFDAQAPTAPPLTPDDAAKIIPRLLIAGHEDQARAVWAAVPRVAPKWIGVYSTLLSIALDLHDTDAAMAWGKLWLNEAVRALPREYPPGHFIPTETSVSLCVHTVWPALSPADRSVFTTMLRERVDAATAPLPKAQLAFLYVQASAALGQNESARAGYVSLAASAPGLRTEAFFQLFSIAGSDERPAVLRAAQAAHVSALNPQNGANKPGKLPAISLTPPASPVAQPVRAGDDNQFAELIHQVLSDRWNRRPFIYFAIYHGNPGLQKDQNQSPLMAMASQPWGVEEFRHLLNSYDPTMFTLREIARATANGSPDSRKHLLDELELEAADHSITAADRMLTTALMQKGICPSPQLTELWNELIFVTPATDVAVLQELADARRAIGNPSSGLDHWVAAARATIGPRSGGGTKRSSNSPAPPLPDDDALDAQQLEALAPAPGEFEIDDAFEAHRLSKLAALDPQIARLEIQDEQRRGLITMSSHPRVAGVAASLVFESSQSSTQPVSKKASTLP